MNNNRVTSFIPDAIREGANIIAMAIRSGEGSAVEWDQIQTTGTKIATITIDDVATDVYAPTGGGGGSTVSWNELQATGTKIAEITIDGTTYDVYAPADTGSVVTWSQVQTTGTKIAEISIDGTTTDVYAPAGGGGSSSADDVSYDNTTSGLTSTNVQDAIDEVDSDLDTLTGTISGHTTDIGNLQTAVASKADQALIAPVLTSFIATASIKDKGTQFIYEGTLYEITTSVTAGTTFVVGTNVKVSDSVTEQMSGVSRFTKLWENPNPTATFAAQTITLASDDYYFLLCIYKRYANGNLEGSIIVPKGNDFGLEACSAESNGARTHVRLCTIANNGLKITWNDSYQGTGTTAVVVNNNGCVPIYIYGIKL